MNLPESNNRFVFTAVLVCAALMVGVLFGTIILPPATRENIVYNPLPDPLDILPQRGAKIAPLNVAAMLAPSKELAGKGKSIYTLRCASCHGADGLGNGPAGTVLNPPPRNFTSANGWKKGFAISQMFETDTEGLGLMPSFDYLSAEERFAVVQYIQTFQHFAPGPEQENAAARLDEKYKLSQGGFAPNKIPLRTAIARVLAEQKPVTLRMPAASEQGPEAEVLRRVVVEPQRAAVMLARAAGWQNDAELLVKLAALGAPENGFAPAVAALNRKDGDLLLSGLRSRMQK